MTVLPCIMLPSTGLGGWCDAYPAALCVGADPDERDNDGHTVVHLAVCHTSPHVFKALLPLLLAHGADVNACVITNNTAAGTATCTNRDATTNNSHGCSSTRVLKGNGATPLHLAAMCPESR